MVVPISKNSTLAFEIQAVVEHKTPVQDRVEVERVAQVNGFHVLASVASDAQQYKDAMHGFQGVDQKDYKTWTDRQTALQSAALDILKQNE